MKKTKISLSNFNTDKLYMFGNISELNYTIENISHKLRNKFHNRKLELGMFGGYSIARMQYNLTVNSFKSVLVSSRTFIKLENLRNFV